MKSYKVKACDMTRTVNAWIKGFDARIEAVQSVVWNESILKALTKHQAKWNKAEALYDEADNLTVMRAIVAAERLNGFLCRLEDGIRSNLARRESQLSDRERKL